VLQALLVQQVLQVLQVQLDQQVLSVLLVLLGQQEQLVQQDQTQQLYPIF